MNLNFLKIFAVVIFCVYTTECARILGIFPTPSISHQIVFQSLMKDLAARGHELTILTPDVIKIQNSNVTQIDLRDSYQTFRDGLNFVEFKKKKIDEANLMETYIPVFMKTIEKQLNHPKVKKLIRNENKENFDLVILELMNCWTMLAFAEVYDCPVVGIISLDAFTDTHELLGNEANPVVHPDLPFSYTHGELSFAERWKSLKYYLKTRFLMTPKIDVEYEGKVRKHFPTVKSSISELKNRISLVMTNTSPAMGFIRPILPNTIQLGFMHIEPPRPLPSGDLKSFLDSSKNGVIYMSLGSNVQSKDLSPETLKIFLDVFGSLDFDVLWKFEADDLPNKPRNVMISKWTPQSDLLAHPAIKLFITQGGQQSMEEAIDRTVPMIVIPFLGDQYSNARKLEEKGIGRSVDISKMTEQSLRKIIISMMSPTYKQNAIKLRELVHDQPMTSRERAVWWTEYVIRHKGAKHLEYPGRLVPFYQKYWLDFACLASVTILLCFKLCSFAWKSLFSVHKVKRE